MFLTGVERQPGVSRQADRPDVLVEIDRVSQLDEPDVVVVQNCGVLVPDVQLERPDLGLEGGPRLSPLVQVVVADHHPQLEGVAAPGDAVSGSEDVLFQERNLSRAKTSLNS